MTKPVLIYDGDCAFCTRCVGLIPKLFAARPTMTSWQGADLASLGLTAEQCAGAVQWVEADGRVSSGHRAFARLMQSSGGLWPIVGYLLMKPPLSWLAAGIYRVVSTNRHHLPGGTAACRTDRN